MLCRYKCRLHSASGFVDGESSKSVGDVCGRRFGSRFIKFGGYHFFQPLSPDKVHIFWMNVRWIKSWSFWPYYGQRSCPKVWTFCLAADFMLLHGEPTWNLSIKLLGKSWNWWNLTRYSLIDLSDMTVMLVPSVLRILQRTSIFLCRLLDPASGCEADSRNLVNTAFWGTL